MSDSNDNQPDPGSEPDITYRRCPCGSLMTPNAERREHTRSLWEKPNPSASGTEYVCSSCGTRAQLTAHRTLVLVAVAVLLVVVGTIGNRVDPIATVCVGIVAAVVLGRELALRHQFPRAS